MKLCWLPHLADTVPIDNPMNDMMYESCKGKYFWYNLFFVMNDFPNPAHGQFGTQHACLGVTWYLQVDMRMFLFIPVIVIIYHYMNKYAALIISSGAWFAHLLALGIWFRDHDYASSLDNDPGHQAYSNHIYFTVWGRYGCVVTGVMFALLWDMRLQKKSSQSEKSCSFSLWLCQVPCCSHFATPPIPPIKTRLAPLVVRHRVVLAGITPAERGGVQRIVWAGQLLFRFWLFCVSRTNSQLSSHFWNTTSGSLWRVCPS